MQKLLLMLPLAQLIAFAQEHAEGAGAEHAAADPYLNAKWLNFAILVVGLLYLVIKVGGPFFKLRSQEISSNLADAKVMAQQSEARVAEMEGRLKNFDKEIAELKARAQQEAQAEAARLQAQTKQAMAKLAEQREAEVASAVKASEAELKAYTASAALQLAQQKLSGMLTPDAQRALVKGFVQDLEKVS